MAQRGRARKRGGPPGPERPRRGRVAPPPVKEMTMGHNSHMPPVPEEERSNKGPGDPTKPARDNAPKKTPPDNLEQQARQGNIHQNTHHQGYQQDR